MIERHVHVLWCDDIRLEAGNKPSFMGVYTAGIVVPELPTVLPRLGVYAWIDTPIGRPFQKITLRIVRDDGFVLLESTPFGPLGENHPTIRTDGHEMTRHTVMAGLMIANLEVPSDCKYFNVVVETETEILEGPKLRISVNPELQLLNSAPSAH